MEGILEPVDKKIIKMIKFLSSSTERFSKEELLGKFSNEIFIKLHGSLDWMGCLNPKCNLPSVEKHTLEEQTIYFTYRDRTPKILNKESPKCKSCGSPLSRLIIPPSFYKFLDKFNDFILRMWKVAKEILKNAQKIIIIGVSFSPSDYYLRWLFKSTIGSKPQDKKPKIEIVNRWSKKCSNCEEAKEYINMLSDILNISLSYKENYKGTLEEYLNEI
ncbi:MAG: hypothetical protein DRP29_09160 [Thermodesulfobacteriota bacterium]|nr:MAG: hypothetical protein DRP29_09160 [Thermodesulfobacteriota bacterium]